MSTGKTYSTKYLLDSNNNRGAEGQILSTTSSGIDWVDANSVPGTGLWVTSGNNIYNSNSGNVGIGTSSPSGKLHIDKANANSSVIISRSGSNIAASTSVGSITFPAHYNSSYTDYAAIQAYSNNLSSVRGSLDLKVKSTSGTLLTGMTVYGTSSGVNVGIGTTSPNSKLEVNGAVAFANVDTFGQLVVKASSGTTGDMLNIGVDTANSVAFIQAVERGTNIIPLSLQRYGGNVGIGTTSPNSKLHLYRTGTSDNILNIQNGQDAYASVLVLTANNDNGAGYNSLQSATNGGTQHWRIWGGAAASTMAFSTGGSEAMRINSSGNVGIGTTSPNAKLDVSGDFGIQGILFWNTGYSSTGSGGGVANGFSIAYRTGVTALNTAYNYKVRLTTAGTNTDSGSCWLVGYNKDTTTWFVRMVSQSGNTSNHPLLAINSGNDEMIAYTNHLSSYPIRWSCETIGISDNDGTLHNMGADFQWQRNIDNLIYSDGNVGIGTTDPGAKLDISNTGTGDSMIIRNDDASSSAAPVLMLLRDSASAADGDYLGQIKFKGNSDTGAERVYAKITAKISDATNEAENSLIETAVKNNGSNLIVSRQTHDALKLINGIGLEVDGDVGVGTDSPLGRLQVNEYTVASQGNQGDHGELSVFANSGDDSLFLGIKDAAYPNRGWSFNPVTNGVNSNLQFKEHGATSVRMTIESGGNVGIGTTNPGAKLEVNGQIVINSTALDGQDGFSIYNNTNELLAITNSSTGDEASLLLGANNVTKVKLNTSGNSYLNGGNVGIGTTSPASKLHVYDTFTKTAANPNTVEVFHNGNVDTNNIYPVAGLFTQRASGGANVFATGLVGVGEKLGNYGYIATGVRGVGKLSGDVDVNNSDMQYMGVEGRIEMEGSNSVNLDDRAFSLYATAEVDSGSHLKEYHGLYLNTPTNNGTILNKFGISQVDANSKNYFAGDVGIGTDSPGAPLHVVGNVKIETTGSVDNLLLTSTDATLTGAPDISLFADTAAADGDTIGNIQFRGRNGMSPGSTAPLTYAAFYSHIIDKDNNQSILALTGHKGNGSGANKTVANFSVIGTNNSGEGAVLINPSSGYTPSDYNLEVNGDFKVVDDAYFTGNVGIGTTSPTTGRKLDVHGNIETTGSLWIGANYSTASEHKIKIGQNRSGNGYAYIDLIGDQAAASLYNLRIIRHDSGANALSQIVHTGTGNFEIKATSTADIILNTPGNVGISNTGPTHKLDVTGDGRFTSTVTATNFILSSDERLKEKVKKVCDNRIKADWKTFELKTEKGQKRYGVIAQELEKTNPEFVREDSKGFKSVAYIDLLIAKIAELEARLEKLEK